MSRQDQGASGKPDRATAAEPVVSALRDGIPSAWRPHLLELICTDRCAEFGDPPCSKVEPDNGYCSDCIDGVERTIWIVNQAAQAIEARSAETERLGPQGESAVPTGCAQPEPSS